MESGKQALSQDQLGALLQELTEWKFEGGQLVRTLTFKDFAAAMIFVNQVADFAELADHHPDIDVRYNRVRLALVSHDAGGITSRDAEMARRIDQIP